MITITGPVLLSGGEPFLGRMRLVPVWLAGVINGQAVINNVKTFTVTAEDGEWEEGDLVLAQGVWQVTFPSAPGAGLVLLNVPAGDATASFASLMVTDPETGAAAQAVTVVADVEAARALPRSDLYELVILKIDGNGGPGFYWYDPTIVPADDNGNSIIAITAGGGLERFGP